MVVCGQDGCERTGCLPTWSQGRRGAVARCLCPAPRERTVLRITSPGRDHNAQFEVRFRLNVYRFHTTVKSKSCKWNHCKSENIHIFEPIERKFQTSCPAVFKHFSAYLPRTRIFSYIIIIQLSKSGNFTISTILLSNIKAIFKCLHPDSKDLPTYHL